MVSSKKILVVSICIVFLSATPTFAQSSDKFSENDVFSDLSALASKHRILLLGETNHGVSQQYAAIAALSEKMVSEYNFELLQSESSFFSTYVELLKNKMTSIQGLSMIYRDTDEFTDFVAFANEKKLLHAGFDPQMIITGQEANFIINHFELNPQQKEIFQSGIESLSSSIPVEGAFLKLCKDLMKEHEENILKKQLLRNLLWANEISVRTSHLSRDEFKAHDNNYRDHAMAMNFLFWDRYFGQKKTIAIGASGHLAFGFNQVGNEELSRFIPMGATLKEHISTTDMVNVALSIKNGESKALNDNETFVFPDVEDALENGLLYYPILLSTDSLQDHASLVMGSKVVSGDWSAVFDYILIFENVTSINHRTANYELKPYDGINLLDASTFLLKDESSGIAIDYGHIYFPEQGEGTTSNEKGLFVIKDPHEYVGSEMVISRIGYLPKVVTFPSASKDTMIIHLTSDLQILDEVVVREEVSSPLAIMQKVRVNLAKLDYLPQLNYYHVISDINDSFDHLQNETIVQLMYDRGFDPESKLGGIDILTRKELNRRSYKKFQNYLSYPFVGITWSHPEIMQLLQHDAKYMSRYFILQEGRQTTDHLVKISFSARKPSRKATGFSNLLAYEGTIWINGDTHLPVKIELFIKSGSSGEFYFSTDFEVKNNTLVTVFSQHKHVFLPEEETNRQVILKETSTWLKQDFLKNGDQVPQTSHDMTLIKYDKKVWDQFNEFIE